MTNQTKWSIDPAHSEISFKVRHLMIAHVKGTFKKFEANIYTNKNDFTTAEIDLWIETSSVSTGDEKRDGHLKGSEFFNIEKHKQITFTSSSMGKKDDHGNHELWGELTICGIPKNVKLLVQFGGLMKDPWGNERAGFTLVGKINRSDWGLDWNTSLDTGGLMLSDEVAISCEIELINSGTKESTMVLEEDANKN
jgi:polyisoprenoid-binding protein YceI